LKIDNEGQLRINGGESLWPALEDIQKTRATIAGSAIRTPLVRLNVPDLIDN